ncbi:MAG: hypothetical protein ACRDI2_14010 [Chloroflexota bacterium]
MTLQLANGWGQEKGTTLVQDGRRGVGETSDHLWAEDAADRPACTPVEASPRAPREC